MSPSLVHRAYAGIGSRTTPEAICSLMAALAGRLAARGWTLRSGAAPGADSAFEAGAVQAGGSCEIYLPWPGFQGRHDGRLLQAAGPAYPLVARVHPRFASLSRPVRQLLARNAHQVLGVDLQSPCEMVICWTPGASGRGGTGTALRLARQQAIPIYDLADLTVRRRICERFGVDLVDPELRQLGLPL
jgi:hypothetical protein